MTLKHNAIVHSLIMEPGKKRAKGVRVIDQETGVMTEFYARIIFLEASLLHPPIQCQW